jgi:hypothetical protein
VIEFSRAPGDGVAVRLDDDEADLLRRLTAEMRSFLARESADDPVSKRLFPDAYEDERESAAYKELVGSELVRTKIGALDTMSAALGARGAVQVTLPPDERDAWLTAITDMRLAIGTRLEVDEGTMARDLDPDDPASASMAILHWLGWVVERMLAASSDEQNGETWS